MGKLNFYTAHALLTIIECSCFVQHLDGTNMRDLQLGYLRSQYGIVSQEPILFDCSIADNIRYGDLEKEHTMEEVMKAAKDSNIHSFIKTLSEVSFNVAV